MHYFHTHRDGVDLVFVSHPCFYQVADGIYQGSNMDVTWRGALLSQAGKELSQSPRSAGRDCPYSYQNGRLTSALTVCPYIAIYQADTLLLFNRSRHPSARTTRGRWARR